MAVLLHPDDLESVLQELRAGLGSGWHIVRAFQYMSGRQAYLAILRDESANRHELISAHRVAKAAAEAQAITRGDLELLRMVCMRAVVSMGSKITTLED